MIELYFGYESLDFLAQSKHSVHYATHSLGFIYLKETETERERSKKRVRNHRSRYKNNNRMRRRKRTK